MNDFYRGRRLRSSAAMRELVRENELRPQDLIMPYFVVETDAKGVRNPIGSMPGQAQLSLDMLSEQVKKAVGNGLRSCLLFGIPKHKDPQGSQAYAENGIVQQAIRMLKKEHGANLIVIADTCLCEYTSHGHCGLLDDYGRVMNDPSRELIAKTALSQAQAGADIVAPSDMMDGRIAAIRESLDGAGLVNTPIMSYAVKYAGAFYGPFREAAESTPKSGDRKSYQMDPANARQGIMEALADINEGADILIVKPAGPFLDMVYRVRQAVNIPVCTYQVSGEFSMIKAAAQNGWIDEKSVALESLVGMKRAGADMIISYFCEDILEQGWI